jgi:hypothetical protein
MARLEVLTETELFFHLQYDNLFSFTYFVFFLDELDTLAIDEDDTEEKEEEKKAIIESKEVEKVEESVNSSINTSIPDLVDKSTALTGQDTFADISLEEDATTPNILTISSTEIIPEQSAIVPNDLTEIEIQEQELQAVEMSVEVEIATNYTNYVEKSVEKSVIPLEEVEIIQPEVVIPEINLPTIVEPEVVLPVEVIEPEIITPEVTVPAIVQLVNTTGGGGGGKSKKSKAKNKGKNTNSELPKESTQPKTAPLEMPLISEVFTSITPAESSKLTNGNGKNKDKDILSTPVESPIIEEKVLNIDNEPSPSSILPPTTTSNDIKINVDNSSQDMIVENESNIVISDKDGELKEINEQLIKEMAKMKVEHM